MRKSAHHLGPKAFSEATPVNPVYQGSITRDYRVRQSRYWPPEAHFRRMFLLGAVGKHTHGSSHAH